MPEDSEEMSITRKVAKPRTPIPTAPDIKVVKPPAKPSSHEEYQVDNPMQALQQGTEMPLIPSELKVVPARLFTPPQPKLITNRVSAELQTLQVRSRQLCLSVYFRADELIRS